MRLDDVDEMPPEVMRIHLVMTNGEEERQALRAFCKTYESDSKWDQFFDYLAHRWMSKAIERHMKYLDKKNKARAAGFSRVESDSNMAPDTVSQNEKRGARS